MKANKIKDAALIETMRYYASIESTVDSIMTEISGQGLLDNTRIAFTAGHGDFTGRHRLVRRGMFR